MGTKASKSACSYGPLINISSVSPVSSHLQLHDPDTCDTIDLCVNVICNQKKEFNCNFNLLVPYRNDYNLDHLMDDIMHNVHKVHQVVKFTVSNICKNSFTEKELKPTNKNWTDLNKLKIIDYSKLTIINKGIYICTDIAVYEHKVGVIECQYMLNSDNTLKSISECPIYSAIRYQYQYSKDNLNHMIECNHYKNELREKPICKFAEACYSYRRIINGASTLKDQCHIKLYRHPIRRQKYTVSDQIQELSFNKERKENVGLYQPRENEYDKENGYLGSLIQELIQNGYEENLFLNHSHSQIKISSITDYPIVNVVKDRMYCVRHKRMGSPLNQSEMLAVIIYTSSDAVYDFCKSQRNANYQKWKWLDYCLYNAILKLSEREHGCYEVYTGFSRMKMSQSIIHNGYFKTYVSTSWFKDVAMEFVDRNGMIMVIDAKFREDNICCDVSWISKFPDENEVLIARSVDGTNNFKCKLLDENDQYIQTVKLSKQEKLNTDVVSEMTHILAHQIARITESDVADLFDTAHGSEAQQPPQNSVLTCAGGDTDDSKSNNTSSGSSNQTNHNAPSDNGNNNNKNNHNHNGAGNGGRDNDGGTTYTNWIMCNNPMCSMLLAEKDKIIAEQSHQILSLWQQNEQLLSQIQSLNVSQPISISSIINNNAPKEDNKTNKKKTEKT